MLSGFIMAFSRPSDAMAACSGALDGATVVDGVVHGPLAAVMFMSALDALSRSAELRRIMIVLVFGSMRLCSRSTMLSRNGLVKMRGGTGGGEMSRGGSSGASGACCDCAADR